jgi:hypothetical protein
MNKFLNFFTAILFISTAILISCGGSETDTPAVDPKDTQGAKIALGPATASTVSVNGVPSTDWASFTSTFTYAASTGGGTFATTGSASDLVWPTNGTWEFTGTGTSQILRSDGVTMDVSVTDANMTLTFDITDPNGRLFTFGGKWAFGMTF